jgi:poly(ADP-ribose) glycohydrolase ARH3
MRDDHTPDGGPADRWRGALLGTALGDAVGAPFEGRRQVEVAEVEAWLGADEQLVWTDDTAMTIGLARSLAACDGEVDPQHLGDTFAEAFQAEPWRGYGGGPPRIFAAAARGTPYLDAAAAQFDGRGSYGNGAAMRAAPAAVVGGADLGRVAALARAQARVTHAHPLGQDGAVLLALAVAAVATGGGADPTAAIAATLDQLETPELRAAATTALSLGPTAAPTAIVARLGNGIAALEAVPAALAAFLCAPDDPGPCSCAR